MFVTTVDNDATFAIDPCQYSSWLRLRRVLAWVNRFIDSCHRTQRERNVGELRKDELKAAEIQLIKQEQSKEFKDEWIAVSRGKSLSSSSKLIGLQPKLIEDGLVRSVGRLKPAEFLSFDVRYPVILPRRRWVTKLILKEFHEMGKHASGTNHTLAALSTRHWIISGREAIRKWEKECMECRRRKAKACQQIMAPLPLSILKSSMQAFTRTSVHFGGPFITVRGRGKHREKR